MKSLLILLATSLLFLTSGINGSEPMKESNDIEFIRKDLNFYSYDKRLPFYKRILGENVFSPYCQQCREWLQTYERMIGISVTDDVLMDPHGSDAVKRLLAKDLSVLESSRRVYDWSLQPLIFLGLARCEDCDGPFSVFGEIHGKASNGTIYFGGIFLMEIEKEVGLQLLETAFDNNLFSNEKMEEKAVEFAEKIGSHKDFAQLSMQRKEAMAFGEQGMTHWEEGNLEKAVVSLDSALKLFETLGDKHTLEVTRQQLGTVHYLRGNLDKAEPLLTSALDYYQARTMLEEMAVCYGILGSISFDQGNYGKAETTFGHALQAARSLGSNDMISRVSESLGNVYKATDRPERASDAYKESLKLAEETGNSDRAEHMRSQIDRLDE